MNKIAAVTGAASGIGQAACRRLLGSGWSVVGMDNAPARLDAVAAAFSTYRGRFRPVACDVTDAAGARYLAGTTIPVDGGTAAAFIPPGSRR